MIYASPELEVVEEFEGSDGFYAPQIIFPTLVATIMLTIGQAIIL
jgi:hypothetical protein